jgi:hypothetical protein
MVTKMYGVINDIVFITSTRGIALNYLFFLTAFMRIHAAR